MDTKNSVSGISSVGKDGTNRCVFFLVGSCLIRKKVSQLVADSSGGGDGGRG